MPLLLHPKICFTIYTVIFLRQFLRVKIPKEQNIQFGRFNTEFQPKPPKQKKALELDCMKPSLISLVLNRSFLHLISTRNLK